MKTYNKNYNVYQKGNFKPVFTGPMVEAMNKHRELEATTGIKHIFCAVK